MKKILGLLFVVVTGLLLISCTPEEVDDRPVLTYAAWNLGLEEDNNIERRLIQVYQEMHPDIRIDVIVRPRVVDEEGNEQDVSWFDFFTNRAATGTLPDVFQVADVTTWLINGWLEDVSDLAVADDDLALVPEDIVNTARFDNKLFALPQAMFYMGFFVNRTVISEIQGSQPVTYGMSYTDLMVAAQKNYRLDLGDGGTGIAGIDGVSALIEWLPAQYDETLDWFTFNAETGYHLDSEAFETAVTEQRKYYSAGADTQYRYVLDTQPEENRLYQFGTTDPWGVGKQSVKWGASYNLRDWIGYTTNPDHALFGHDIDFIGTPSVGDNHRVPIIMDYIAVGRGTQMRAQAYDFAKFMGYGIEGYQTRLDIALEHPEAGAVNFAPIAQSEALIDAYFDLYPTMTEYRKLVEDHTAFISESLWKVTPNYWISRGSASYDESHSVSDILNKVINGELNYADVKVGLNQAANNAWLEGKERLDDALALLNEENDH